MSAQPRSADTIVAATVRDCELPRCTRPAARGRAYCSVEHLRFHLFREDRA